MPAMTEDEIAKAVEVMAKDAMAWGEERSQDRRTAIEYYDGIMVDTPSDPNRSTVVSRDFRSATKKVLPAIVRTILGGDQVVEYPPVGQGDEQMAEQATEYVNLVVLPESNGRKAIMDAIHDALRVRNGILKWWWDDSIEVKFTRHSGLDEMAAAQLVEQEEGAEVVEASQDEQGLYTIKLRRKMPRNICRVACVPSEEFHIAPDALCIEESIFVAHNQQIRRNDLIAMGYDQEKVMALPAFRKSDMVDDERITRQNDEAVTDKVPDLVKGLEEIDCWECYVRLDVDDDGIAEMRRIVFAGGWNAEHMLENYECDEAPFCDVVIERRPHEWQGRSLFDDVRDIQRIKTVLLRNTLDNIYWQNNLQPTVQEAAIKDMDAVYNPSFGKPIVTKPGFSVQDAVAYNTVPFVAKQAFDMLAYMDDALIDRTGISDQSGGLPPDALQNVTAKASALMEQQGIAQVELMVRTVADGLKRLFKGVLKTIIQHQDKARTVRLRNEWVQFDPKSWNAGMDVSINVGLGAGTRERDMLAMQLVNGFQEKLIAGFGPDNPFVKPDNLYNSIAKLYEAAGLKNVDLYLTKPDPAEIQAKMEAQKNQPNPEQVKAEAQAQLEQMKMQGQMQVEQMKAEMTQALEQARLAADAERLTVESAKQVETERAQMEADLQVKAAERDNQISIKQMELAFKREELAQQRELELLKIGLKPQEDGSVKTEGDMQNEALMSVVQNMQGIAQAMQMTVENLNKPKRIVRDPTTNKAIGMETVN